MADVYGTHIQIPTSLGGAGDFINNVSMTIVDELTLLKGRLAPVAASWTGEAFQFYEDQQDAWNLAADGLFGPDGVMGIIAHALNVNWMNYTDAELANKTIWKH